MHNSYEIIDKWINSKFFEFKKANIGLVINFFDNGVSSASSVSKCINVPLFSFICEQGKILFPTKEQINYILELGKFNKSVLLCFDEISNKNQNDILAVQKLLIDFNSSYKTLSIIFDPTSDIKLDYYYQLKDINNLFDKDSNNFKNLTFI